MSLLLLPARGKKIPEARVQCLALTFLAKAAGFKSVFDLVLSQPSKTPGDSKVITF